ncbi:hypothetical protein BH23ACI1_BH23ACI1_31530 [soil metagenome]
MAAQDLHRAVIGPVRASIVKSQVGAECHGRRLSPPGPMVGTALLGPTTIMLPK